MKKIKLFVLFSVILFPFIRVAAQPKIINTNNKINLSILLSKLSLIDMEKIAQVIVNAYLNKQLITELDYNFTSEEAQIIQKKLLIF